MDALLLAVLNALWQGAVLIGLVALALRAGLRRNAPTACVVWSIAFAVVALLPALDLVLARPASAPAAPSARENVPFSLAGGAAASSATRRSRGVRAAAYARPIASSWAGGALGGTVTKHVGNVSIQVGDGAMRVGGAATAFGRAWGLALLALWALVAGALLVRLARAYAAVARMKRDATPIDDPAIIERLRAAGHRRRATVARSPHVEIPCAVGFTRPMILVPARLASSLDAEDLARVVLHESAHLQRYDDWTNALEQIVCALQFFQPALYFARRSIDFEREVACDDRVLEDAGEPLRYAECLARIVQRHVRGHQAAVVPGFVLRRAQVVARVRRIVDRSRDASPHLRLGAAILGGGVMIATLGIARLQVPVVAPAAAAPDATTEPRAAKRATETHTTTTMRNVTTQKTTRTSTTTTTKSATRTGTGALVAQADPTPSPSPSPAASPYVRALPRVHPLDHGDNHATAPTVRVRPVEAYPAAAPRAVIVNDAPLSVTVVTPVGERVRAAVRNAEVLATVRAPVAARSAMQVVVAEVTAEAPRAGAAPVALPRLRTAGSDGDLLDAIDEAKYPHPSIDDLIALRNQGVSADYVRRMGALGRVRPSLHELLALAVQGVTPEYVGTLDARLASPPSLDQVIGLRVQGVRASWLDGLAAIGYPKLSASDATALAVQGVSVTYVHGLLDAGLRSVTPQQLLALRVQGVDGTFVRRLAEHGYRNLSVDELVRLKVSGFQP